MDLQSIIMRSGLGHASCLRAIQRTRYPRPGVADCPAIQETSR
jgi:hypothetical protein